MSFHCAGRILKKRFLMNTPEVSGVGHLSRIVAVSYRDKECMREGVVIEQRPTMVLIVDAGKSKEITLPDENHEMCFLKREARTIPPVKHGGKAMHIDYTEHGIRSGDIVLMVMGGSGAFYAFGLSKHLEKLGGGKVSWIGSTLFKRLCDEHSITRSKVKSVDDEGKRTELTFDHLALSKLYALTPEHFHTVSARERDLILLKDVVSRRREAMDARMACAHRVRQRLQKEAYCTDGVYPEGGVKVFIEEGVANDAMLTLFEKEEQKIGSELKKLLHSLPVWKVFDPIERVGEFTAAPLIVAIGDINRFPSDSQLKAFLGVHTLKLDGTKFKKVALGEIKEKPESWNSKFARRRQGQLSNWNQEGRQSLYLIAVQFMMWAPNSPWGLVAQEVKKRFLEKYPTPEVWVKNSCGNVLERVKLIEGKCKRVQGGWVVTDDSGTTRTIIGVTKYNPAHINRMVAWRTMTKFVEWLYRAWKATEAGKTLPALPYLKKQEVLVANVSEQKVA
jgi:hypothetical protein